MTRILLCVPSFDRSVRSLTDQALGNLDRAGCEVEQWNPRGYGIARARNFMAARALDGGFDYLLMCDSDIIPPKDALVNLLACPAPVRLGWYVRGESDDGRTNMVKAGAKDNGEYHYASEIAEMDGPFEVRRGGMGFALVETGVFRAFPRPWFEYHDRPDGSGFSEDYDFCRKCWDAGLAVMVDPQVGCGHVHERVLEAR